MRNEHDRNAARLEIADNLEQQRRLVGVEAGGRLVEHQNARVLLEGPRDRDQLLDGDRIGIQRPLDVDVDAEPLQALLGDLARRAPRNQTEFRRLSSERQVLRHRHGRHEVDFLIDGADAERPRLARRIDLDRLAVEADLAFVATQRAGQNLDQRRLSGAVLAHQGVNFASQ